MGNAVSKAVDYEPLKRLLLEVAGLRSLDELLRTVVVRLCEYPDVALARIWLKQPGDICTNCPMRSECPDQTRCLHLVASAGRSLDGVTEWSHIDGQFRRVPLGAWKVGLIAAKAEAIEVPDFDLDRKWLAVPEWAQAEDIHGFSGQPLMHDGDCLGVLAVFFRIRLRGDLASWLRMIADHVAAAVANARAFEEIERLRAELASANVYLREEVGASHAFGDILGSSPALTKVLQQVEMVAPTGSTVLIRGETGTGKELVARALHDMSPRQGRTLVKLNCAAIPTGLLESELFGHEKGAFTGAVSQKVGRFELANKGTLFLDEVGDIPLELQPKLLRVLQEQEFERLGGTKTIKVDVRLVAATHLDLAAMVADGRFREDLYYRLNVFPVMLPPLRERRDDIPHLVRHFTQEFARRMGRRIKTIPSSVIDALVQYRWPGNVRELQNVIERAVILCSGPSLQVSPGDLQSRTAQTPLSSPTPVTLADAERQHILGALRETDWVLGGDKGAAARLGIKRSTLQKKMQRLGICRPQ
jgi:formate hydrogenlyase transcriptional activator